MTGRGSSIMIPKIVTNETVTVISPNGISFPQTDKPQPTHQRQDSLKKHLKAEIKVMATIQIMCAVMVLALGIILASVPSIPHFTSVFSILLKSGYPLVGALFCITRARGKIYASVCVLYHWSVFIRAFLIGVFIGHRHCSYYILARWIDNVFLFPEQFSISGILSIITETKMTKPLVHSSLALNILSVLSALIGVLILSVSLAALEPAFQQCQLVITQQLATTSQYYHFFRPAPSNKDCFMAKAALTGMKGPGINFSPFVGLGGSISFLDDVSDGGDGFITTITSLPGMRASADSFTPTSLLLNLGSLFIDADQQCVGAWPGFTLCRAVVETELLCFLWENVIFLSQDSKNKSSVSAESLCNPAYEKLTS
ncbi:MS4a6D protein [Apodemus speciosus]|uniref:MS4a6D protein n=1 Tax=Apodemus speciosus TaxID=105296 RepID=A0ABQ0FSU3_APOSI